MSVTATMLACGLEAAPYPFLTPATDVYHEFYDNHGLRAGRTYEQAYANSTVMLGYPSYFDPERAFDIVVYLHGQGTDIAVQHYGGPGLGTGVPCNSDPIWYGLGEQLEAAGRNCVLIAPQLPRCAATNHAGKLTKSGGVSRLVAGAGETLKKRFPVASRFAAGFASAPIILVSYSGGYEAAYEFVRLDVGMPRRVRAMLMIDSVYGYVQTFADWIRGQSAHGAFVSLQAPSTGKWNLCLRRNLGIAESAVVQLPPPTLAAGTVCFYTGQGVVNHFHIPVAGPPKAPLAWFLQALPVLPRFPATGSDELPTV